MLADAGRDDGLVELASVAQDFPQPLDRILRHDGVVAVVEAHRLAVAPFFDLTHPVGEGGALGQQSRVFRVHLHQSLEGMADVADDGQRGHLDLVDLRRIDVDVDDLAVLGELADLARDAVVEAHAEGQQQVGFVDGVVGVDGAVHAEHVQAQKVIAGKAAQAMHGQGHRDTGPLGEGLQMAAAPD